MSLQSFPDPFTYICLKQHLPWVQIRPNARDLIPVELAI
ncbi:hypothetical protein T12_6606 [Trichinella patagoniensis]|uniref:Uncharacterized protein n=1 Tax=Trichinella patagoniensis TaxID=990121 RepID=A0A0V0YQZ9_9BILA|nr:hypothetical protein T12_6606 [Trichinella patagoniensis]